MGGGEVEGTKFGASRETQILVVAAFTVFLLGYHVTTWLFPYFYARLSTRIAANTALDAVSHAHRDQDETALEERLKLLSRKATTRDSGAVKIRRRNTKPSRISIVPAEQEQAEVCPPRSSDPPRAAVAPNRTRFSLGDEQRSAEPAEQHHPYDPPREPSAAITAIREAVHAIPRESSRPGPSAAVVDHSPQRRAAIIAEQDAEYLLSIQNDLKKCSTENGNSKNNSTDVYEQVRRWHDDTSGVSQKYSSVTFASNEVAPEPEVELVHYGDLLFYDSMYFIHRVGWVSLKYHFDSTASRMSRTPPAVVAVGPRGQW